MLEVRLLGVDFISPFGGGIKGEDKRNESVQRGRFHLPFGEPVPTIRREGRIIVQVITKH